MDNAITEVKSILERINSTITEAEEKTSEVEDRIVDINETERKNKQTYKRIKRNEDHL